MYKPPTNRELMISACLHLNRAALIIHRSHVFRVKGVMRLRKEVSIADCKLTELENRFLGVPPPKIG